jgi:hypothetical protein
MSTIEELLERKGSGSGPENRDYGSRDPSRWPRGTLYPQKLALTSPTSGGRSLGIVRSRTQATEFLLYEPAFTRLDNQAYSSNLLVRVCLCTFWTPAKVLGGNINALFIIGNSVCCQHSYLEKTDTPVPTEWL